MDFEVVQTILSLAAGVLLLVLLNVMLGRIRGALAGINESLAKIAWGVSAIEQETAILKTELPTTASVLTHISEGGEAIAGQLTSVESRLAELAR